MSRYALVIICCLLGLEVRAHGEPRVALTPLPDGRLRARISDSQALSRTDVTLQSDAGAPVTAGVLERVPEPITIAFLVCGWSEWIGRDELPTKDPSNKPGALRALAAAIDKLELSNREPPESRVVLIRYGNAVEILDGRVAIFRLKGSSLGTQSSYEANRGVALLQGIATAIDQLEAATTPRKAMIVIGDGRDSNVAQLEPARLARRAHDGRIAMYSILWRVPQLDLLYSTDPEVVNEVIPSPIRIPSPDSFESALRTVIDQLPRTYDVTFDGAQLPWDGMAHEFTLRSGRTELATVMATLPSHTPSVASPKPADAAQQRRWLWGLLVVGIVGLAIGLARLLGRKRAAKP